MATAVVIDAGPLLLLARSNAVAIEWLEEAVERNIPLLCAGATYAEVWRGHSQSPSAGQQAIRLDRVLGSMTSVPTDEMIGRGAGKVLAAAGLGGGAPLTIDAIVVATAIARAARVLTCDPDDIRRLSVPAGVYVETFPANGGGNHSKQGSRAKRRQRRRK